MDAPKTPAAETHGDNPRRALASAKRVVIKIGSRAIMGGEQGRFQMMADQAAELMRRGHSVVIVSSGAVGLGATRLGMAGRPKPLPMAAAAAAVGQSRLMQAYETAFAVHSIPVAQVLLTHDGIKDRARYLNVQRAMEALFELGVVPIINENDAVSTEELKFGDNDQLAAMVAPLVSADLLVLLTDVEGLLDEGKRRIGVVHDTEQVRQFIWQHASNVSLGGMLSKVGAAERALRGGIPVVIAPAAAPEELSRIMDG